MNFDIKLLSQNKIMPKEQIKLNNDIQNVYKKSIFSLFNDKIYENNPINYTSFEELINSLKISKIENNDKSQTLKMFINEEIFENINESLSKDKNDEEEGLFDNNIKIKQPFYINKLDLVKGNIVDYIKKYKIK